MKPEPTYLFPLPLFPSSPLPLALPPLPLALPPLPLALPPLPLALPPLPFPLVASRLGQGTFRIDVTEAYNSRCAMTKERTLPALEAAHIHRYSAGGVHQVSNGLLIRSDLHRLFDRGYITVDSSDLTIIVSRQSTSPTQ